MSGLFRSSSPQAEPVALVHAMMASQARKPIFYARWGVPDTLDGRFELLALHLFLLTRRLKGQGAEAEAFSQSLFDLTFAGLDMGLRELGVGDLSVGPKVKAMARAFYGQALACDAALALSEPGQSAATLEAALKRNLFGTCTPDPAQVCMMAGYVVRQAVVLHRATLADIMMGRFAFVAPDSEA